MSLLHIEPLRDVVVQYEQYALVPGAAAVASGRPDAAQPVHPAHAASGGVHAAGRAAAADAAVARRLAGLHRAQHTAARLQAHPALLGRHRGQHRKVKPSSTVLNPNRCPTTILPSFTYGGGGGGISN